jgi:hypothetical protein
MKLGPLAVAREEAFAYLAFGEAGLEAAIETTDAAGLAALRSRCGDEVLKCEPALAECAAAHGLEVVELPQPALATKAALGLGFEHGSALEPMAPDLLLDLLEATHDFAAAEPWNVFEADEPLAIRVEPSGRVLEGSVRRAIPPRGSTRPRAAASSGSTSSVRRWPRSTWCGRSARAASCRRPSSTSRSR